MYALVLALALAGGPDSMKVSWLGLELQQRPGGAIAVVKAEGPAAGKIAAGDQLVAVLSGDHPGKLAGVTLCELWPMLVGPFGEAISLRFMRAGKPFDAALTRTDPPGGEQLVEGQRMVMRAMALQPPDGLCGTGPVIDNSAAVTAFSAKLQKAKNPCDLKWLKAQPEVESWQVSPAGAYSVFLKGGGPPVAIACGHGD